MGTKKGSITDAVKEWMEGPDFQQLYVQTLFTTLQHPLDYARTLMQLGYEPLPPIQGISIFGAPYLAFPNTFQYLKYIKSVDGFLGCFRGLGPRLGEKFVFQAVYKRVHMRNPFVSEQTEGEEHGRGGVERALAPTRSGALIRGPESDGDLIRAAKNTAWEMVSVSAGIIASQPLYVISVRSMAQFVGRETKYNTLFEAIKTILDEEGILGFFGGLVPRIVGETLYVGFCASLTYLIGKYLTADQDLGFAPVDKAAMMASTMVANAYTYQFHVVANVMAVNNSSLAVGNYPFTKSYIDWVKCWRDLAKMKQLKRGSTHIFRSYTGPTLRVGGLLKPTGFHIGPRHPPGLGTQEKAMASSITYIPPAPKMSY